MPLTLGRSSRRQAAGHPGETGDELRKPRTGTHGPQGQGSGHPAPTGEIRRGFRVRSPALRLGRTGENR